MKNLTNLGENIVKKIMRKISPTNLGENIVKKFMRKISQTNLGENVVKKLWEKYRQQILEKNIVNKSVRTAAADSWRGDIIEFPINGPPLSEAEQGSYNCTRDIVSSQITSLGVNESILSAPSCDQGIGMVGDPTTQDNIPIWLVWFVWTVCQRIKLALCHVYSKSLSSWLPLVIIIMTYNEDRNLVIFDNFHKG